MKNYFLLFIFLQTLVIAQKKKNGTIYIEHPTIELVKKFDKAFTSGDTEKIKKLVTEDFKLYNGLSTNFANNTGSTLDGLLRNSKYWSEKLDEFKIESRGVAYPDAFEFKGGRIWVYTYDILSGYDKENGFKIKTTGAGSNADGVTNIYIAFAEEPLVANVGTNAVPATAR